MTTKMKTLPESASMTTKQDSRSCCCRCCRGISCVVVVWILLTSLTACASCVGFFLPYWLQGSVRDGGDDRRPAYLGLWRRCNYLRSTNGSIDVVMECGRYTHFEHIPSVWGQVSAVTVGMGCVIQTAVLFFALLGGCCGGGVLTVRTTRVCALLQLIAGKAVSVSYT